jgi:hypothetical protein
MAANKSSNKVRVTALLGGGGILGMMDPKVNMNVAWGAMHESGKILALDSGNFQVTVGVTKYASIASGVGVKKFYPHQLNVLQQHATGTWSWPTGDGSVTFGHHGAFPNGVPTVAGTGMAYYGGDDTVHLFNRVPND